MAQLLLFDLQICTTFSHLAGKPISGKVICGVVGCECVLVCMCVGEGEIIFHCHSLNLNLMQE